MIETIEELFEHELNDTPGGEHSPLDAGSSSFNIGAGQKAERYEIASHDCLIETAEKLSMHDVAALLEESLQEEEAALSNSKAIAPEVDVADQTPADELGDDVEETTVSRR